MDDFMIDLRLCKFSKYIKQVYLLVGSVYLSVCWDVFSEIFLSPTNCDQFAFFLLHPFLHKYVIHSNDGTELSVVLMLKQTSTHNATTQGSVWKTGEKLSFLPVRPCVPADELLRIHAGRTKERIEGSKIREKKKKKKEESKVIYICPRRH